MMDKYTYRKPSIEVIKSVGKEATISGSPFDGEDDVIGERD